MYNFNENASKVSREFGLGGGFLKLDRGDTRLRILEVASKPLVKHFVDGKPILCSGPDCPNHTEKASVKYPSYILLEGNVLSYDIPNSVYKAVGALQLDQDYAFNELPMPYDIKIKYDPDASPAEMYKVIPSPKRELLADGVVAELAKKKRLDDDLVIVDEEPKPIEEKDLPF